MELNKILSNKNIAEDLDEQKLIEIGKDVIEGFENDKRSRKKWEDNTKEWMKLALQISDKKTFPWTGASNVKYPLIATAGMQFAARAYPTLIPADGKVVKCGTVGSDPQGLKAQRSRRISSHMSYQVMVEMEEWEEEMDKLLVILPIVGIAFKKTYYDPSLGRNYSCLIHPDNLVVNYWTASLEKAFRISEIFYFTKRDIQERVLGGSYLDVMLGDPVPMTRDDTHESNQQSIDTNTSDDATPYTIIEQHTYLDLDKDGYAEPYVVTVEYSTRKVLRIVARFREEGVTTNDDGAISRIEPIHFYTKFPCIPNPDGSFYDIGFGHLLGPINESVNTLVNQLIDSGSLNNLQSGFIGKGLKIRMSDQRFQPGEWKSVNNTADDLRKNIFPLPTKEPSNVLFQLLGMLIQSGKELASVADIFTGKMPGQNTPAYTTQQTVEQGMKLYTAVYKRIFRSLTKEFRKLYDLNALYLDPQQEVAVLDEPIQQTDYMLPNNDIVPAADPSASSQFDKQQKVAQLMQILQIGTLDPMAVTMLYLEAGEFDNPEQLLIKQQPQPDPKVQQMQMKAQLDQQKAQLDAAMKQKEMELKEREMVLKQQEAAMNMKFEAIRQQMELEHQQMKSTMEISNTQQKHQAEMLKSHEQHQMGMAHKAEQLKQQKQSKPNKGN